MEILARINAAINASAHIREAEDAQNQGKAVATAINTPSKER